MIEESSVGRTQLDDSPEALEHKKSDIQSVERQEVVFVLRYDEEITYLVNEGVTRPALLPSGFKDS